MSSDTPNRPLGRRSCLASAALAIVAYFGARLLLKSAALAIVAYFGARLLLKSAALEGPLRIVVAMLPVPFFLLFLLTEVRYMRNLDEMQRRIQLEASPSHSRRCCCFS